MAFFLDIRTSNKKVQHPKPISSPARNRVPEFNVIFAARDSVSNALGPGCGVGSCGKLHRFEKTKETARSNWVLLSTTAQKSGGDTKIGSLSLAPVALLTTFRLGGNSPLPGFTYHVVF